MMATTLLSTIGNQLVSKGFGALFSELVKHSFKSPSHDLFTKDDLEQHFATTFTRCTKVKTLLSRDEPVDLLQTYVNTIFTFAIGGEPKIVDDYELIERLREAGKAIIYGTAGGGKTIFMRYCWIAFFVSPGGRLPIFFELRRLNDLTTVDLISFVYRSALNKESDAGLPSFKRMLNDGKVIFLLDGFDEVSIEKRVSIEGQIIDLARRYPKLSVIVSGRPDERFDAWQDFTKYSVNKLNRFQVIDLVQKVTFDNAVRAKFISAVKKDLYDRHESFLSTPLLITMMLLTFQYYAEIPNKIHVFYDLAFDTLFSMHDALKEAFNRKKYTSYPIDVFKRRLACFCLVSYIDQKFEFTSTELNTYISKSGAIDGVTVDAEAFQRDLLECVCIMQKDGLAITFTHRSFQEYFTSYCLTKFSSSKLGKIIPRLALRGSDSVIEMLYDMNRDLVEEAYLIEMCIKQKEAFGKIVASGPLEEILTALAYNVSIAVYDQDINSSTGSQVELNELVIFRRIMRTIYADKFGISSTLIERWQQKDNSVRASFPRALLATLPVIVSLRMENEAILAFRSSPTKRVKFEEKEAVRIFSWFKTTGHSDYIRKMFAVHLSLVKKIPKEARTRQSASDGLLGLVEDKI